MREIINYECEFCGDVFDDEEECAEHELLEHGVKQYTNEIHCWNYKNKPVNLIEVARNHSFLSDDIAYIKCDSIEAVHAAIQIFDIMGEYSPYENDGQGNECPEGQELDLWYYPTDFMDDNPIEGLETNHWVNLTNLRNEITSRMETIGIEERKI